MDKFYILNSDTLEDAFDACVCAASEFGMIVIDSLAALPTQRERNNDMDYASKMEHQDILTHAFSVLGSLFADKECTLIVVDQLREDLSVSFGNPFKTIGSEVIKYYASLRFELCHCDSVGRNRKEIGSLIKIFIKKNKISALTHMNNSCYAELHFGKGFYEVENKKMQKYDESGNLCKGAFI